MQMPEDVAQVLSSAGYSRVRKALTPGDFEVSSTGVYVLRPAVEGAGWSVSAGEVLGAFDHQIIDEELGPGTYVKKAGVEHGSVQVSVPVRKHTWLVVRQPQR